MKPKYIIKRNFKINQRYKMMKIKIRKPIKEKRW